MDFKILNNLFNRKFFSFFTAFIALEILSWAVFLNPSLASAVFILICLIVAAISFKKIENGLYLLLAELFVGGFGYLFFWPVGGFKISLRLALFLIFFVAWLWSVRRGITPAVFKNKIFISAVILGLFWLLANLKGVFASRALNDIFLDGNAYLYFGLLPAFLTIKINYRKLLRVLFAGSTALALKTVVALFAFSRQLAFVGQSPFYAWIRDARIGEITAIAPSLFRIFCQSHFYNLIALLLILAVIFLARKGDLDKKTSLGFFLLFWLNLLAVLISQSRTFWLAGLASMVVFFIFYLFYFHAGWRRGLAFILLVPILIFLAHFAVNIIINDYRVNLFSARLAEAENQAGVSSRSAQIAPLLKEIKPAPLFGRGFAKTVSYQSADPRIKNETNPDGWLTTYSFELGYLEMILKLGLFGFLAYLFFIYNIFIKLFRLIKNDFLAGGLLLGLLALLIAHAFSPYLNHPLGIGFLLILINYSLKN